MPIMVSTLDSDYSNLSSYLAGTCRIWRYRDGAGNTYFSIVQMRSCRRQGHAGSKTLLQQSPPVVNCECQLTQVVLNHGRKTVVVICQWNITTHNVWRTVTVDYFTTSRRYWRPVPSRLIRQYGSSCAPPLVEKVYFFFLPLPLALGEFCRADVDSSLTLSKSRAGCQRNGLRRYIGHGGSVIWTNDNITLFIIITCSKAEQHLR